MRKKSLTFLLALVTSVGLSWAQGPWYSGDCTLTLSNGVMTVSGSGAMGDNTGTPAWESTSSTTNSIVIGDGVTYVGAKSFYGYYYTTTLTLGNSVERIGNYAFSMCIELTAVEFPSTLQTIGASAFNYCQGLTSLSFPAGLLGINDYAFSSCTGLTSVTCAATTPPTLGTSVFNNVSTANIPLYVPAGSVEAYQAAAQWNTFNIQAIPGGSTPSGDEGKLPGAFSINGDGDYIAFSKGNLQYHCTNHVWQFATNQYDIIGGDNANISDSYNGWIDLFGYGTGNNPTLASTSCNDYSTFTDWGVNAISNGGNVANQWRTLTKDEWVYLFNSRTDASSKYGMATIANLPGIIVLPDVYAGPAINTDHDAWNNNTISAEAWAAYDAAGAVFLPAAGYRGDTSIENVGEFGFYWSSTPDTWMHSYKLGFTPYVAEPQGYGLRYEGLSVRLVQATSAPTDQDIADVVIALINAIPNPVAYNDECKDAIDAARAAYDALNADQKALVENYGVLLDAETAYAQLTPTPGGDQRFIFT